MDERFLVLRTPGPYLQSTYSRQQETSIHILKPTLRKSGNSYEHILDLGLPLEGPPFEVPRFQNVSYSPTEPGPNLGKDGEDLNSPHGDQERDSSAALRTPVLDACSSGYNRCGPPSWSQTRFKLNRPAPSCVSTVSFPHPGKNAQFASDLPYPHDQGDLLRSRTGRRRANNSKRKSCEYCRFRKKKCSGHDVCIRCFRIGVHCVYMPDLVAKRAADCLLETPSSTRTLYRSHRPYPNSGTRNLEELSAGQLSSYSCVVSSSSNDVPMEASAQLSEKGAETRKSTRLQESLRAGNYLTQALVFDGSQPILRNSGPNSAVGDLGSGCGGLVLGLTSGVATGDAGSQFNNNDTTQPGHFENIHTSQPVSATTLRWFPQSKTPSDVGLTGAKAVPVSEFDALPPLEIGLSLESYMDLSAPSSSPSSAPLSSNLPMLSNFTQDHDLIQVWTVDEWLTWYDLTSFRDSHDSSASSGPRRISQKHNTIINTPEFISRQTSPSSGLFSERTCCSRIVNSSAFSSISYLSPRRQNYM